MLERQSDQERIREKKRGRDRDRGEKEKLSLYSAEFSREGSELY